MSWRCSNIVYTNVQGEYPTTTDYQNPLYAQMILPYAQIDIILNESRCLSPPFIRQVCLHNNYCSEGKFWFLPVTVSNIRKMLPHPFSFISSLLSFIFIYLHFSSRSVLSHCLTLNLCLHENKNLCLCRIGTRARCWNKKIRTKMVKANDKWKIKKWWKTKENIQIKVNSSYVELKYLLFFSGNSWDFVLHFSFNFIHIFIRITFHLFNFEMLTCCSFAFGICSWEKGARIHSIDVNSWIHIFPSPIIQQTNIQQNEDLWFLLTV